MVAVVDGISSLAGLSMLTLLGGTLPVTELGMVTLVGAWKPALRYVELPVFFTLPVSPLALRRAFLSAERSSYEVALFN